MNMEPACRLCGTLSTSLIQRGVRYAPELEVHRCQSCGLVRLSPLPDEAQLRRYYATSYREEYGDPSWEESFRTGIEEAQQRCQRLRSFLKPQTRILEIGCGAGAFLYSARPSVAEVWGIEPSAVWREQIQEKLKVSVASDIMEVPQLVGTCDLVVAFHVLEHVLEPVAFLRSLARFLKVGGHLVIEVPNVDDALVSVYQVPAYQEFYYQKAHLHYFAPATLARVFQLAGLNATVDGVQRYDVSNHLRWLITGRPGGAGFYDWLFSISTKAAYAESLIRAGRADTLWAAARRE